MKSIKPGRGPSMMGGIMSIAVGIFGVLWTAIAISIGGGVIALFGVVFVGIAIAQAVYHFKNATGENRYSVLDITDEEEEPDPLNERFGRAHESGKAEGKQTGGGSAFCPYCGTPVEGNYTYCNKCGKKLP